MKLNYYPETDSLYIDLSEKASVESREISVWASAEKWVGGRRMHQPTSPHPCRLPRAFRTSDILSYRSTLMTRPFFKDIGCKAYR